MDDRRWLNEMMDAALDDESAVRGEPDFRAILGTDSRRSGSDRSSGTAGHRIPTGRSSRLVRVFLAAAVLAVILPGGLIAGRSINRSRLIRSENALFVQELIGGTLFDEGLAPPELNAEDGFLFGSLFEVPPPSDI